MSAAIITVVVIFLAIFALCFPPALALLMAACRHGMTTDDRRTMLRIGMVAAAFILTFNFGLILFAPPHLSLSEADGGLTRMHAVALVLSWLCLWAALAMGLLMRRRRRSIP